MCDVSRSTRVPAGTGLRGPTALTCLRLVEFFLSGIDLCGERGSIQQARVTEFAVGFRFRPSLTKVYLGTLLPGQG